MGQLNAWERYVLRCDALCLTRFTRDAPCGTQAPEWTKKAGKASEPVLFGDLPPNGKGDVVATGAEQSGWVIYGTEKIAKAFYGQRPFGRLPPESECADCRRVLEVGGHGR